MSIAPSKKSYVASIAVAALGIFFVLTNCLAVTRVIMALIDVFMEVTRLGGDPSQAAAVIGETVIATVSRIVILSLVAILPAILLYLALVPMRLRARWFYSCASIASLYLSMLLPFGTVCGIVLLVALRRRRGEFMNNGISTTQVTFEPQTSSSGGFQSNAETEQFSDGKPPGAPQQLH